MTESLRDRFPLFDLHSHSTASDGSLTPTELVQRAVAQQVNVLALTDHDTVSGLAEARQTITDAQLPLQLINGIELSTCWENIEIHIVGLNIDPESLPLQQLIAEQQEKRHARSVEIAVRLEKYRIPDALAGAQKYAQGSAISRGHYARYLVELGIASTMQGVFKKYLAKGKIGYVPPQWCTINQAISTIHAAGGQAVLAHPARYGLSAKWLKNLLNAFANAGGDAIEVAQCQQAPHERSQLAAYAKEYHLSVSQGSDFHQPCAWIELGRKLWLPADCTPVWDSWLLPSDQLPSDSMTV
ncbi:MAG: RNase RNM [Plesiomonas sp.]